VDGVVAHQRLGVFPGCPGASVISGTGCPARSRGRNRPLCEPADVPDARPRFAVLGFLLQEGAEDLCESLWFFQEG
jgi:hypothetical protein